MSLRSSALILVLSLAVLFSLICVSSIVPRTLQYRHYPNVIPTEPKISQLQAMEIAVQALIEHQNQTEDSVRLYFPFYNYSRDDYEKHPEQYENKGYYWTISTIRQHPELLRLSLIYVHPNGTGYQVNATDHTYARCDSCGSSRETRQNHLLWSLDLSPIVMYVDAETGKIISPNFDTRPFPRDVQIYENISKARTVKQIVKARLDPPETTQIEILKGAANNETGKVGVSYEPTMGRAPLEISNKFLWTNRDTVAHTVTSDNGYSNEYAGKFDSGTIQAGATYEYAFMDTGEYSYHCEIHPWMKGRVEMVENFA